MNTEMMELEARLKAHDWSHIFSDDDSKWHNGMTEENELKKIAKIVGEEGQNLFDKYMQARFPNASKVDWTK